MKIYFTLILVLLVQFGNTQKIFVTVNDGGPSDAGGLFSINVDGTDPDYYLPVEDAPAGTISGYSGLVKHSNGKYYGVTDNDDIYTDGVLYEYDPISKTIKNIASFMDYGIYNPTGRLLAHSNGKIYGTAASDSYIGAIYEYNPTDGLFKVSFKQESFVSGFSSLGKPHSEIVQDGAGFNYYTSAFAGPSENGTLVRFKENGRYEAIYNFSGNMVSQFANLVYSNNTLFIPGGGAIGKFDIPTNSFKDIINYTDLGPNIAFNGGITLHSDGFLYSQVNDYILNREMILKIDTSDFSFSLVDIGDPATVGNFYNSELISVDGKLYSVANIGGAFGLGTLVEYDPLTESLNILYTFDGSVTDSPFEICSINHTIYGLSTNGIFKYDINQSLYSFELYFPFLTQLIKTESNELLTTYQYGGINNEGSILRIDTLTFDTTEILDLDGGNVGMYPMTLNEIAPGKFHLSTLEGASFNEGAFFIYDSLAHNFNTIKEFYTEEISGEELGDIVEIDGDIYGVSTGGFYSNGFLFRYNVEYNFKENLANFNTLTGIDPKGGVTLAPNGKLYGMTYEGGTFNKGTIFEYDTTTKALVKKYNFIGASDGAKPISRFILGSNNNLYALTNGQGGGTLIDYNYTTNTVVRRAVFDNTTGFNPRGSLLHTGSNIFYGVTYTGYTSGLGSLFKFDANINLLTIVQNLTTSATGANPISTPIIGNNNQIYFASQGRISYYDTLTDIAGVLFGYDSPNNGYFTGTQIFSDSKLLNFINRPIYPDWTSLNIQDFSSGSPFTNELVSDSDTVGKIVKSIMKASDGNFYYTTINGGQNLAGTIVKLDPNTLVPTKLYDLSTFDQCTNGMNKLVEFNGKFYSSGSNTAPDNGRLFEFDPITQTNTIIHNFNGTDGDYPSELTLGLDNILYGVTTGGGTNNQGVIFSYNPTTSQFNVLFNFSTTTGDNFYGSLLAATNGKLYGVTSEGLGGNTLGLLFSFDPSTSNYQILHNFTSSEASNPSSILRQVGDLIIGISYDDATVGYGTIFTYNIVSNIFSVIHHFDYTNGSGPLSLETCESTFAFTNTADTLNYCIGTDIYLTPSHTGNSTLYQWYYNGSPIVGENNDTLFISSLTLSDGGEYSLSAYTECGITWSSDLLLTTIYCDSVYPGDTDFDGIVTMTDLFHIGTNFNETGPIRAGASLSWTPQFASNWTTFAPNGLNAKHIDCDGNGIIGFSDTNAIISNYNNVHQLINPDQILQRSIQEVNLSSDFNAYNSDEWMTFNIDLGSSLNPATNIYGVSFDVVFETNLVQPDSFNIVYPNVFPGIKDHNIMMINNWNDIDAKLQTGMVRYDKIDTTGNGTILSIFIKSFNNSSSPELLSVVINNIKIINLQGEFYNVTGNLQKDVTINGINSIEENHPSNGFVLYQQSGDVFTILNKNSVNIKSIELIDLTGKLIIANSIDRTLTNNSINISKINQGIYIMRLTGSDFIYNQKVQIAR